MQRVTKQYWLGLLITVASAPLAAEMLSLDAMTISGAPIESAAQQANAERRAASHSKAVIEAEQLNQFGDQPLGDALRRLVGVSFAGANRAREVQLRVLALSMRRYWLMAVAFSMPTPSAACS